MTERTRQIDPATLTSVGTLIVGGTAYPPLPIEPMEARQGLWATSTPRTQPPAPSQPTAPAGPAYPSLPLEPDTRDGNGGGRR